ncbi:kunitz trypsin inhibitor 5-like [Andrographis paniculata]|uniref:kunitz trypsin inhibitor 5-like n=1 Tax=Andrographis paniculata TaxID=175694 RepID=UPI0021E9AAF2|nr:kunitz trypsin inhibitor 5-like [Andrographis paniculata]
MADGQPQPVLTPPAVIDTYGNALQTGSMYYILSAQIVPDGGPITRGIVGGDQGPMTVVQDRSSLRNALPIVFYSATPGEQWIRESVSSVTIRFQTPSAYLNSTIWQVAEYEDKTTRLRYIQLGGVVGKPGCKTYRNWFKIIKNTPFKNTYRIQYDPRDVCPIAGRRRNIAVFSVNGMWPLALTSDYPYSFVFQKFDP